MAIPKYQYIKDELKNKIISGQFASGDKFYTEAELISMYDVSSITVDKTSGYIRLVAHSSANCLIS